jgi:hypothetical protein
MATTARVKHKTEMRKSDVYDVIYGQVAPNEVLNAGVDVQLYKGKLLCHPKLYPFFKIKQ